jgi:diguanylate cyclase (GGDEF)-like protein
MKKLKRKTLNQLIAGSAEPLIVVQIDRPEWPVVLCNPAFEAIAGEQSAIHRPFADVVEQLLGRELAVEVSEILRSGQETSITVELHHHEYLLVLRPVSPGDENDARYYAAYWRAGAGGTADGEMHQALLKAKRRIRDLSRDDPVTGLLNIGAFREVVAHDWAVAARKNGTLALVCFTLDDFHAYLDVFGRHAADSCLRRVAKAIRRCLRRASDVVARVDEDKVVVLSHSSDEEGVENFAAKISATVFDLGLHHPRSKASRFVTVSFSSIVMQAGVDAVSGDELLDRLLSD